MSDSLVLLHISLIKNIGPQTVKKLREGKVSKWSDLYLYTVSDFISLFSMSTYIATSLYNGLKDNTLLNRELSLIKKYSINWMTIISNEYPLSLKSIYAPPTILYWKGKNLFSDNKLIACIGSRKANFYGKRVTNLLVNDLVNNNWTIVSGGAIGIDSISHNQAIMSKGKTVVVLGSGLLRPYPMSNKNLFQKVIETGGSLVSSFPLMMQPSPGNFPARNRIIAGLSKGCIVVQAAEKSGARITAQFALEQGKEVFAVPGSIYDPLSKGCHLLLQEGAKLVESVNDILSEFGYISDNKHKVIDECNQKTNVNYADVDFIAKDTIKKNGNCKKSLILAATVKAISFDDLIAVTNVDSDQLNDLLFDLQMDGKIEQDFSGLWHCVFK